MEELKELEKLLFKYREDVSQKLINNGSIKNKQYARQSNDVSKVSGYVSLDILERLIRKVDRE